MVVEALIGRRRIKALVDTGATHNFMHEGVAKSLGIRINLGKGTIKSVNTSAKPVTGEAKGVQTRIGDWNGTISFTVVAMDDYDIVLGLQWIDQVRACIVPYSDSLIIVGHGKTSVIPTMRELEEDGRLSAMRFS